MCPVHNIHTTNMQKIEYKYTILCKLLQIVAV